MVEGRELWRPLNEPLRKRFEVLNETEGITPTRPVNARCAKFPVDQDMFSHAAPRPFGIERLRGAEMDGGF